MADRYDLVIIGAGPGGYVAAIRAAQLGMKVGCIDKRAALGGTCLNIGCIPSKALLESSELFHMAKERFGQFGIKTNNVVLDLPTMQGRKDTVVKTLTQGIAGLFRKQKIAELHGTAKITGPGKVEVSADGKVATQLEAKSILIATGSEPTQLPFMPFDGTHVVSSTEALAFDSVPEHFIVVGGGYIGLELGSVWNRLGSKVTVLEFLPRLLPVADAEIAGLLHRSLVKQGFNFQLETKVTGASVKGKKVTVTAEAKGKPLTFEGDKVLVAVGRRPYTQGLGLEEVGVQIDPKTKTISVDENYQTNVAGIYAIGDAIPGPMLAHKAEEEAVACVERMTGKKTHVNYELIPSVIYTWPEVSSVGLTEEQLKEQNRAYNVGKFPFAANSRAKTMGETEGVVKMLADARTDRILGVHIIGPRASDLIAEAVAVMEFGGSAEDVFLTCHSHPTLSEAVKEAALAVHKRTINA